MESGNCGSQMTTKRNVYITINKVSNGYTVSNMGDLIVAYTLPEALEIVRKLME